MIILKTIIQTLLIALFVIGVAGIYLGEGLLEGLLLILLSTTFLILDYKLGWLDDNPSDLT